MTQLRRRWFKRRRSSPVLRFVRSPLPSSSPRCRPPLAGFTLLEILLCIALIGLLAGVLVGGASSMLNAKTVSVDDVFWKAVQEARKTALQQGREVKLHYFDERERGRGFAVGENGAGKDFSIPAVAGAPTRDLTVEFISAQKGNTILVGGLLLETQTLPSVTFYPDGTCTPFRLQIVRNGATHQLAIDPWTCAQILTPPDPNAPRT